MNTYNEFVLFIIFLSFGVILGIAFGIINMISILCNRNKYLQIALDIIDCLAFTALYIALVNVFNWGQIRLYLVLGYLIGIIAERKTVGKLFAKYYYKLYNWVKTRIKLMSDSKFGKFIKR